MLKVACIYTFTYTLTNLISTSTFTNHYWKNCHLSFHEYVNAVYLKADHFFLNYFMYIAGVITEASIRTCLQHAYIPHRLYCHIWYIHNEYIVIMTILSYDVCIYVHKEYIVIYDVCIYIHNQYIVIWLYCHMMYVYIYKCLFIMQLNNQNFLYIMKNNDLILITETWLLFHLVWYFYLKFMHTHAYSILILLEITCQPIHLPIGTNHVKQNIYLCL